MKKDVAKQRLQQAMEGMTLEEKFQVLLDVLNKREVVLTASCFWFTPRCRWSWAKKVVVNAKAEE